MTTSPPTKLNWLLDGLVEQVPPIRHAIVLSSDGMLVGTSQGLDRDNAEHLSAIASSFQSLARGASRQFDEGGVRQTIVEMDSSFLFVIGAGAGACLAVLAESDSDLGLIAFEMARLVKRMGEHLSVGTRTPVGNGHGR
ncbi:putative regulator of Ras-like GTPase activity (Roadblock/LC7/MglB family) [Murinocardiopsis flavida]|uniref:Putative regulator of Ras-like GTPase activity (Roadblock/LC7/MglB family) n=1 Tax=Murinocardiopsis flavida TaxID=645275 RepID=A0A2P8DQ24_9ACTN|nr:roadblock/LC7 domain-containing protein [Murinocardiopsis flavida]PSK99323.1 putative regulator of Ras-like GTPase activity (Roadblock/LC7/MglB family) [Murinocardiopsis flavida]